MTMSATYAHTNLIAEDWQALARFYQQVFGCVLVREVDFKGEKLDAGVRIAGAHLRGVHMRLPGHGDGGPTLEIFNYNRLLDRSKTAPNRPGYGHVAFRVEDIAQARHAVVQAGGREFGEVTTMPGAPTTWCYVTDPEGNLIELLQPVSTY
ncbi:MAG TPA: VOC family protein [bacterium]|nr:VOC family protein [bacterium]